MNTALKSAARGVPVLAILAALLAGCSHLQVARLWPFQHQAAAAPEAGTPGEGAPIGRGRQRGTGRSTFSASGLTMFVGWLLTKLTTLSNAALKYSS